MAGVGRATARNFPIGASLTLAELSRDPYPAYARLREQEPVSWVPALGMWLVTRYADVRAVLSNAVDFTTDSPHSTIANTFGSQMLSLDGPDHDRFKSAFQPGFTPAAVRASAEQKIRIRATELTAGLETTTVVDLRTCYAARLPILTMLDRFDLPGSIEPLVREFYDSFEAALANHIGDATIAARARTNAASLSAMFAEHAAGTIDAPGLTRAELDRNLSIIFFGGISTVEALLLNTLVILIDRPTLMTRAREEPGFVDRVIEEAMRWSGPVQSATRHAARDVVISGVGIGAGATVNCMLASANRDDAVFVDPDRFDPDRPGLRRHLGFALGSHHCLGNHLARAEVRVAVETLLADFAAIEFDKSPPVFEGHEFRQPNLLRCYVRRRPQS